MKCYYIFVQICKIVFSRFKLYDEESISSLALSRKLRGLFGVEIGFIVRRRIVIQQTQKKLS